MNGLYVQDVKYIDHPELIIVAFANVVLEKWIIIVHGMFFIFYFVCKISFKNNLLLTVYLQLFFRINNCVGEKNQKYFVQFLFFVCILSAYTIILVIMSWVRECHQCKQYDMDTRQTQV